MHDTKEQLKNISDAEYLDGDTARVAFHTLEIGALFHTGRRNGSGADSEVRMVIAYRKETKSTARVVRQVGYRNTRAEGKTESFASGAQVRAYHYLR